MQYVIAHWRGELSLTKAFLLSFLVGYVALVLVLVAAGSLLRRSGAAGGISEALHLYVGSALFLAWFMWALVGVARTSLRIFGDPRASGMRKALAVLALFVVVAVVAVSANDLLRLFL